LVYGLAGETLVLLDEEWALAAIRDIAKWKEINTIAEALALVAEGTEVLGPPFDPETLQQQIDDGELDRDEQFDLGSWDAVQEMSWPGAFSSYFIPDGWEVGSEFANFVSSGYHIEPDEEPEILRLARRDGITIRRDDELIGKVALDI
jgi:hypothetical protein